MGSGGAVGRLPDGGDDVGVSPATAEVAAHELADLVVRSRAPLAQQRDRRHDLPRRAVAALQAVVLHEGGLHGMERAVGRQPLDRDDLGARLHRGQRQASLDAPAVAQDGAGAALPQLAALLGAGEVQVVAERVEQRRPRVERQRTLRAVDAEGELDVAPWPRKLHHADSRAAVTKNVGVPLTPPRTPPRTMLARCRRNPGSTSLWKSASDRVMTPPDGATRVPAR